MGSLDSNPMTGLKGRLLSAPGVKGKNVGAISKDSYSLTDYLESIILKRQEIKDPFYVLDLGEVAALMDKWTKTLPMVEPFYAVKCNPEPALLGCLAALGSNFDCASPAEIEAVLSLGVSPDRIVYANPCKAESHIKHAASVGVDLTTFDTKDELEKMHRLHPKSDLLIRIKAPDDNGVRCPLGPKYGAVPEEVEPLLQAAKASGLSVVGVSFHVGSGGTHSWEYGTAIAAAKSAFETAVRLGMPRMKVLNIGGGFTIGKQFEEAAVAIKAALQAYFSDEPGVRVISEPGRILSETAEVLVTNIIGKRVRGQLREYWVNDGIYGSMNCILHDRKTLTCSPLACTSNPANPTCDGSSTFTSTVFGPTCDALDTVVKNHQLPELKLDDWLVFPNMGAYTLASGSNFNGFNTAGILTYLACSNPSRV